MKKFRPENIDDLQIDIKTSFNIDLRDLLRTFVSLISTQISLLQCG